MKKSIEITIQLKASPSKVWQALTTPALIEKYFFGAKVSTDWQVGSPIYFRGEYQGTSYEDKGIILQFTPEKTLSYSYLSSFSNLPDRPESYQMISYHLSLSEDGTKVTITQENLKENSESHKAEVIGHWKLVLDGLKKTVE